MKIRLADTSHISNSRANSYANHFSQEPSKDASAKLTPPPLSLKADPIQREKDGSYSAKALDPHTLEFPMMHREVSILYMDIQELKRFEKTVPEESNEESGEARDELVQKIAAVREKLDQMSFPGLTDEKAKQVRTWAYREINLLSPYYSQGRAVDFLDSLDTPRLCNLTCMAMALEAFGKSAADYTGNMEDIQRIRNYNKGEFNYDKLFDKAKLTTGDEVTDLRLPDFLQLALVARRMAQGRKLLASVKQAYDDILFSNRFGELALKFGLSFSIIKRLPRAGTQKEKFQQGLGPHLDAGNQVIISTGGHFVRLQSITEEGLIIDDPGRAKKKNMVLSWAETKGYFKRGLVISK